MRRFLILAIVVLLVLGVAGLGAGSALAKTGPFLPGDLLFPTQHYAEQTQAEWQDQFEKRTVLYFNLAERRLENMVMRTGTIYELMAMDYLGDSIDQVIQALLELPEGSTISFKARFLTLVELSDVAVSQLTVAPTENPDSVASFLAKLSMLQRFAVDPNMNPDDLLSGLAGDSEFAANYTTPENNAVDNPNATINPLAVPFPANSPAGEHAFYPLFGQHAVIECEDCHMDGVYDDTPATCEACHAGLTPVNHYVGDCASCHTPVSWEDVVFDHTIAGATDCVSCHGLDKPVNHYGGQCSACHNTAAWKPADFNHQAAGATNCLSCHSNDKPSNHFGGQCSACHSTSAWMPASFNHQAASATNCQSCHSDEKPSNHYSGQCSACHETTSWKNVSFNHSGQTDCASCHSGDKPVNHYSGQCSACHNTSGWDDASFSHSGLTDCASCHSGDKPSNHYSGQCSACHNSGDWDDASFSHSGLTDCASCHSGDKPSDHYSGQCSQCHNSGDWDAEFSHSGLTNCKSCHSGDRPSEHDGGQCSECHNTSDWDDAEDNEDDEEDENGSLNLMPRGAFASVNSSFDCNVCHSSGDETVLVKGASLSPPSWWSELLEILQAAFSA